MTLLTLFKFRLVPMSSFCGKHPRSHFQISVVKRESLCSLELIIQSCYLQLLLLTNR